MIATQMDAWRAASVVWFAGLETQAAALAEARARAQAQWRAGLSFWAGLNPMLAPWLALASALDPDAPAVSLPGTCGPLPAAPRRAPARRKTA